MTSAEEREEEKMRLLVQATARTLMGAALSLIENDPHSFSTRPCSTCSAVSAIAGRAWGCSAKANRER
jgi:hypothetical protein